MTSSPVGIFLTAMTFVWLIFFVARMIDWLF